MHTPCRPLTAPLLALIALLASLAACQRSEMLMDYKPVSTTAWETNDKVSFDLGPFDADADCLLALELRTTTARPYPFKDLYLEVRQLWSQPGDAAADSLTAAADSIVSIRLKHIAANDRRIAALTPADTLPDSLSAAPLVRAAASSARADASNARATASSARADSLSRLADSLSAANARFRAEVERLNAVTDSVDLARRRRISVDTILCRITADEDLATGIALQQYHQPVGPLHIRKGQTARISIRHIMSLEAIPGISDVGISLERQ